MNKTQKGAWFCLVVFLLSMAVAGYSFYSIFVLKQLPDSFLERYWSVFAFIVILVPALILIRKKQSPAEVESDERDRLIMKRAVLISFVSIWILLAAGCIIPRFIVGYEGCIPIWVVSLVNVYIFMAAMFIYSCAVLIQYIWGGKDGQE